jgi:hypothetical protein
MSMGGEKFVFCANFLCFYSGYKLNRYSYSMPKKSRVKLVENCAVLFAIGTSKIPILDGSWLSVLPDYSWQNIILRRI